MQSENLKSVNFNGQLTESGQKGANRSAFQTLGCIVPKKIVWDQIEKTPKHKGCKMSITLWFMIDALYIWYFSSQTCSLHFFNDLANYILILSVMFGYKHHNCKLEFKTNVLYVQ